MNEIKFFCVLCGSPMSTRKESAGDVSTCPKCAHLVPVPPLPGEKSLRWSAIYPPDIVAVDIIFHCPKCDARLGSDARTAGNDVFCPPCGSRVKVPHLASLILPPSPGAPAVKTDASSPALNLTREEIEFLNNVTQTAMSSGDRSPAHASQR